MINDVMQEIEGDNHNMDNNGQPCINEPNPNADGREIIDTFGEDNPAELQQVEQNNHPEVIQQPALPQNNVNNLAPAVGNDVLDTAGRNNEEDIHGDVMDTDGNDVPNQPENNNPNRLANNNHGAQAPGQNNVNNLAPVVGNGILDTAGRNNHENINRDVVDTDGSAIPNQPQNNHPAIIQPLALLAVIPNQNNVNPIVSNLSSTLNHSSQKNSIHKAQNKTHHPNGNLGHFGLGERSHATKPNSMMEYAEMPAGCDFPTKNDATANVDKQKHHNNNAISNNNHALFAPKKGISNVEMVKLNNNQALEGKTVDSETHYISR